MDSVSRSGQHCSVASERRGGRSELGTIVGPRLPCVEAVISGGGRLREKLPRPAIRHSPANRPPRPIRSSPAKVASRWSRAIAPAVAVFSLLASARIIVAAANVSSVLQLPPVAWTVQHLRSPAGTATSHAAAATAGQDRQIQSPGLLCDQLAADPEDIRPDRGMPGVERIGDPGRVVDVCSRAIVLDPSAGRYWDQRGRAYEALRSFDSALSDYRRGGQAGFGPAEARWAEHLFHAARTISETKAAIDMLIGLEGVSARAMFWSGKFEYEPAFRDKFDVPNDQARGRAKIERALALGFIDPTGRSELTSAWMVDPEPGCQAMLVHLYDGILGRAEASLQRGNLGAPQVKLRLHVRRNLLVFRCHCQSEIAHLRLLPTEERLQAGDFVGRCVLEVRKSASIDAVLRLQRGDVGA